MATFVNDSLTDTNDTLLENHVGETGATWTKHPSVNAGTFRFASNRIYCSAVDVLYYASGDPATPEYTVAAPYTALTTASSNRRLFLAGRIATGADTFYWARWHQNNTITLLKKVAGSSTVLANNSSFTIPSPSTAALELLDATKKFYIGGVERLSSTDNAITAAGKAGLGQVSNASTDAISDTHLDSFSATDAAGGEEIEGAVTEGFKAGDTFAAQADLLASTSDQALMGDTVTAVLAALAEVSEGASLGDAFTAALQALADVSEGAELGDAFAARADLLASVSEGVAMGDTFTATLLTSLDGLMSEGILAGDQFAVVLAALASLSEGFITTDQFVATVTRPAAVSDGVVVGDLFTATRTVLASLVEGFQVGDTFAASLDARAALTEGTSMGDTFDARASLNAALSEGAVFGDTFSASLGAGDLRSFLYDNITLAARFSGTVATEPRLSGTVGV